MATDPNDEFLKLYHGTRGTYQTPESSYAYANGGLYGSGYYMTSDPRVASNYAMPGMAMYDSAVANGADPGYLDVLRGSMEMTGDRANVRAINVPKQAQIFDVDAPGNLDDNVFDRVMNTLGPGVQAGIRGRMGISLGLGYATNHGLYDAMAAEMGKDGANEALAQAGFLGLRYDGGQRIPITGPDGQPVRHDAYVIFPQQARGFSRSPIDYPGIYNAISGQEGGHTTFDPNELAPNPEGRFDPTPAPDHSINQGEIGKQFPNIFNLFQPPSDGHAINTGETAKRPPNIFVPPDLRWLGIP